MLHVIFGTGPLGQAVASTLRARGDAVRLVNRSGQAPAGFEDADVVAGDLTVHAAARRAADGAAVVYHCAAPPYPAWARTLPDLMTGAIDAAASAGARLVYGDNLYAYAPVETPLTEATPEHPSTRKGQVRKVVADQLRAAHAEGRVEVIIGRGSDFYGPGVHDSFVGGQVFGRLADGKRPRVLGDPDQPHTFTYIEDFGRALVVLADHDEAVGGTWHVPSAPPLTTRAFAEAAAHAMGRDAALQTTPSWMVRVLGLVNPMMREIAEMLYAWEQPYLVDHSRFQQAFGDAFGTPTPLRDGIAATAAAFSANR